MSSCEIGPNATIDWTKRIQFSANHLSPDPNGCETVPCGASCSMGTKHSVPVTSTQSDVSTGRTETSGSEHAPPVPSMLNAGPSYGKLAIGTAAIRPHEMPAPVVMSPLDFKCARNDTEYVAAAALRVYLMDSLSHDAGSRMRSRSSRPSARLRTRKTCA